MVRFAILILTILLLGACSDPSKHVPAIAIAYAGPATLNIRKDIQPESAVVAKAKHGERLEIIQNRRNRFIKVRTAGGVEGWTDAHLLLTPAEITTLRAFEKDVQTLPSQGVATTYETLNVHTEPDRQSPSFIQLKENEKFDVLAHRLAPHSTSTRKPLVPAPVKKAAVSKKKPRDTKHPPPPMPPAPKPPADWRQMSVTPPEIQAAEAAARQAAPPVPVEDWSLIRTTHGESGWVLTSRLFMAIPDEVAQYAEGKRISSYFSLGETRDEDRVKHTWLWTTISSSTQPYDFDSFRVFIWSLRRHRYETAYIERNLKGYFPVKLEQVRYGAPPKSKHGETGSNLYPGFSICMEKRDGNRSRRSFAFMTNIVRFAGERPCEVEAIENPHIPVDTFVATTAQPESHGETSPSMYDRFKGKLANWRKRWFGR